MYLNRNNFVAASCTFTFPLKFQSLCYVDLRQCSLSLIDVLTIEYFLAVERATPYKFNFKMLGFLLLIITNEVGGCPAIRP